MRLCKYKCKTERDPRVHIPRDYFSLIFFAKNCMPSQRRKIFQRVQLPHRVAYVKGLSLEDQSSVLLDMSLNVPLHA
jgi:hypothetical protein